MGSESAVQGPIQVNDRCTHPEKNDDGGNPDGAVGRERKSVSSMDGPGIQSHGLFSIKKTCEIRLLVTRYNNKVFQKPFENTDSGGLLGSPFLGQGVGRGCGTQARKTVGCEFLGQQSGSRHPRPRSGMTLALWRTATSTKFPKH